MGSDFSKQICCVTCGRCKEQEVEEANEETSETKPILQTSGEASICPETRPSTLALEVPKQVSGEVQSLRRVLRPSAAAAEENVETGSAGEAMGVTEGWVAAWDSVDPADGETKGEGEVLAQVSNHCERDKGGYMEEKIKPAPLVSEAQPVTHVAWGVQPVADPEQHGEWAAAGSEGSICAGVTHREGNSRKLGIFLSETLAGLDPEIKPPGESLIGENLLLCAVQMPEETETYLSAEHVEGMERAKLGKISPWSTMRTELTSLVETPALLTVQATQKAREAEDPLEAVANGTAEMYSACAMPWECPERETLELTNQLLDFLEQEIPCSIPAAQEMERPRCAEPEELSEGLCRSSDGMSGELEDKECDAGTEAEPQHRTMQQTEALPEEPLTCLQTPVNQGAELLHVAPSLSQVFGSSGEVEAEKAEA